MNFDLQVFSSSCKLNRHMKDTEPEQTFRVRHVTGPNLQQDQRVFQIQGFS